MTISKWDRICFISRSNKELGHRVDHWVDRMCLPFIGLAEWVDRKGWPFFWLTDWVGHFLGRPKRLTIFGLTIFGLTIFWVERKGWPFFGLTFFGVDLFLGWPFYGLTEKVDLFFGLTQLTGWATGLTTNTTNWLFRI